MAFGPSLLPPWHARAVSRYWVGPISQVSSKMRRLINDAVGIWAVAASQKSSLASADCPLTSQLGREADPGDRFLLGRPTPFQEWNAVRRQLAAQVRSAPFVT